MKTREKQYNLQGFFTSIISTNLFRFKLFPIYLKCLEVETEDGQSFCLLAHPSNVYSSQECAVLKQEPGIQFRCPMWMASNQIRELTPASSQTVHQQETEDRTEDSDPCTVPWDTDTPSSSLPATPNNCSISLFSLWIHMTCGN